MLIVSANMHMPRLIRALAAIHIDEGSDQIANIHKVSIWMKAQAKFRLLASLDVMRIKMSCSDFFLCLSYFCEQYTNLCPKLQCLFKIKEYCFRVQKLTFHTYQNQNPFIFLKFTMISLTICTVSILAVY